MTQIDTHVHIDFYPDPHKIAKQYENLGIYTLFVTNLPEVFQKHHQSFNTYRYVRLCLGYHPQVASEYKFNQDLFEKMILNTKYIGEVGLDYKNEHPEIKSRQVKAFEYITSPEFNKGRIYSIHTRQTEDLTLEILINNNVKHAIFHWYSGKLSTLDKIIDHGYYFSVNPKMLEGKKGGKIIERIPHNRILFETDGPFAKFNNNIITPHDFNEIYLTFDKKMKDFEHITFTNFKRLLIEKDLFS